MVYNGKPYFFELPPTRLDKPCCVTGQGSSVPPLAFFFSDTGVDADRGLIQPVTPDVITRENPKEKTPFKYILVGGFSPTHLRKHMRSRQKGSCHFPNFRGENFRKYLSCHHLVYHWCKPCVSMMQASFGW